MLFGLDDETIALINKTFDDSLVINEVVIYGSRAKGNYREGSDIDFVITSYSIHYTKLYEVITFSPRAVNYNFINNERVIKSFVD